MDKRDKTYFLAGIAIDQNAKVYAYDHGNGIVMVFDTSGTLLSSFQVQKPGDDHWGVRGASIAVAADGDLLLGGWDNAYFNLIHRFTKDGKYKESFFPYDTSAYGQDGLPDRVWVVPDRQGGIWCVHSMTHVLYHFNSQGKLTARVTGNSRYYIAPKHSLPTMSPNARAAWYQSFSHVLSCFVTQKGQLILLTMIGKPKYFLLEIFDEKGKLVWGDILTDTHRLVGIDQNDLLYFEVPNKKDPPGTPYRPKIAKYAIAGGGR
jgi:hypothetical protein